MTPNGIIPPGVSGVNGVSLEELCQAKLLDREFVARVLGWRDGTWAGRPAVVMPYDGKTLRYRVSLEDQGQGKYRWPRGTTPRPYLPRFSFDLAWALGWVLWVEGESDVAQSLQHGLPAVGVPGAATFKESWLDALPPGVEVIVWPEPDPAGRELAVRIARAAAAKGRPVRVIAEVPAKDLCDLRTATDGTFRQAVMRLVDEAIPGDEYLSRFVPQKTTSRAGPDRSARSGPARPLNPASEGKRELFREYWRDLLEVEPPTEGVSWHRCPFHPDQHASLRIDWTYCGWKCFGCGRGGGLAELMDEAWRLSRRDEEATREHQAQEEAARHPYRPRARAGQRFDGFPEREALVRRGKELIAEAAEQAAAGAGGWATDGHPLAQIASYLRRKLEDEGCCGTGFWRQPYRHGCQPGRIIYHPTTRYCRSPGHQHCLWETAQNRLAQQRQAVNWHFPAGAPYFVVRVELAGHDAARARRQVRKALTKFKRSFRGTGYGFLGLTEGGCRWEGLVRTDGATEGKGAEEVVRESLLTSFRHAKADVLGITVVPPEPAFTPFDYALELWCRAKEDPFLLVAEGRLDPLVAAEWLARTTRQEDDSDEEEGSSKRGRARYTTAATPGWYATAKISSEVDASPSDENSPASDHWYSRASPLPEQPEGPPGAEEARAHGTHSFNVGGEDPDSPPTADPDGTERIWEAGPDGQARQAGPDDGAVPEEAEPCAICGQPGCWQKPARDLPMLTWRQLEQLRKRGRAEELPNGLLAVREEHAPKKRPRRRGG